MSFLSYLVLAAFVGLAAGLWFVKIERDIKVMEKAFANNEAGATIETLQTLRNRSVFVLGNLSGSVIVCLALAITSLFIGALK